jgi:SnoaL-like domain
MSDPESELDELRREVRCIKDRQAILDCINRYCRGLDRLDADVLGGSYHEGALDRHGPFIGTREEFVPWAIDLVRAFPATHHSVTTHNCEIDGDRAYAESYCLFFTIMPDGKTLGCGAARYVDQLERRAGRWAIVARCEVMDCAWELPRSSWLGSAWEEVLGRRDLQDLSYSRPLHVPRPLSP